MNDRLIDPNLQEDDSNMDLSLRPTQLKQFVGQENVINNLDIAIKSSKIRKEPIEHVMLYGPPGLGKTTLAYIIAKELGVNIKISSGPSIERSGDMAAILTGLEENDVLFIDEVHRLNRNVEEVLYPAMEDFNLSWMMGKGMGAKSINLQINKFSLISATTRYSMVSAPLRDRFGIIGRLNFYEEKDMALILERSAKILGLKINEKLLKEIAKRTRGTPRVSNRLLRRIRDYALVKNKGIITDNIVLDCLDLLQVDTKGLDQIDNKLLESLIKKFNGGPVGLDTLAASINEDSDTVMDVCEPYLLQQGFLDRSARGRKATKLAYSHLGLEMPENNANDKQEGIQRSLIDE